MNMNLTADDRSILDVGEMICKLTDAEYLLDVVIRWMESDGKVGVIDRENVDAYRKSAFYTDAEEFHVVLRALRARLQDAKEDAVNVENVLDKMDIWSNHKQ